MLETGSESGCYDGKGKPASDSLLKKTNDWLKNPNGY
jgi:hypothetical protein